jgi:multisubunit Na+/H+ antiporter MnhG subunit
VAIVVIALDFVIIGFLLVRSVSLGMLRDMRDSRSSTRDQSKGLILTIVGFIVWTAVCLEARA